MPNYGKFRKIGADVVFEVAGNLKVQAELILLRPTCRNRGLVWLLSDGWQGRNKLVLCQRQRVECGGILQ